MDIRTLVIAIIGTCSIVVSTQISCPGEAKTCTECFLANPKCAWCTGEIPEGKQRCSLYSELTSYCRYMESSSLFKEKVIIKKKKTLRPKRPITPQRIQMSLRKDASATIRLEVLALKKTVVLKLRHSRALGVVLKSDCKGFKWKNKMATCLGVTPGKIRFRMVIKMKRCLSKSKTIRVTIDGNKKKSLKIKLTSICSCDCEKDENIVPFSRVCNGHGDHMCGVCACRDGYYGDRCMCDASQLTPNEATLRCTTPGDNSVCSGRGDCVCGQCECHPKTALTTQRYTGQYCECDNFSCDYQDGALCGGKERGVCRCGVCECNEGYEGMTCESFTVGGCVSPLSGTVCNGVGLCVNDRCECIAGQSGNTCDGNCPGDGPCPGVCKALKPCVECFAYGGGELTAEQCRQKCGFMREMSELVEDVVVRERGGPAFRMCMFSSEDGCFFKFSYNFNVTDRQQIKIDAHKMC